MITNPLHASESIAQNEKDEHDKMANSCISCYCFYYLLLQIFSM